MNHFTGVSLYKFPSMKSHVESNAEKKKKIPQNKGMFYENK